MNIIQTSATRRYPHSWRTRAASNNRAARRIPAHATLSTIELRRLVAEMID